MALPERGERCMASVHALRVAEARVLDSSFAAEGHANGDRHVGCNFAIHRFSSKAPEGSPSLGLTLQSDSWLC